MKALQRIRALVAFVVAVLSPAVGQASFHQWEIKEIFTNATGTVQFIEMFTTEPFEGGLDPHNIVVTSDGVAKTFEFDHSLTNPTDGKHFLMATAGFGALAGGVAPDFSPLPSNFFVPNATSITFNFAHNWDILTLAGSAIPKDGINSLTDADLTPEGGADVMVVGVNSPTNFAGAVGSVNLGGGTPVPGDFNGDSAVNGADLALWRTHFGNTGAPTVAQGNADADADVDGRDFLVWQRNVRASNATPAIAAIPEPSTLLLAAFAAITACGLALRTRERSCFMPKP